ncbi:MAG: transcription termination/antitermination protein NusA [Chloroflexi bacterium]|nr:transcription termination/antitermination protein NusA [Chloroflexota bacterium]|tara:strand:- start:31339 stop:32964 length:1626 start_codon:yes stop_codon:yes gene_type:complete
MKNEFVAAITQLSAEKNLNADTVFVAVEAALASSFRKDDLQYASIETKIDRITGDISAWQTWSILDDDEIEDDEIELSPERAKELGFGEIEIGSIVRKPIEITGDTGRIAAQTAKQVVLQRLRDAERDSVFQDFSGKEGELISGTVLRVERGRQQVVLDLGQTEAVLPYSEQIRSEHYRVGQRIRVYIKEVYRATRGPQVLVSRATPDLLGKLLELEVPEISRGSIKIISIARDPGFRSKVAVASKQQGIDPIGAIVGVRGARIQNIVNELNAERIDIIRWDPNELAFASNALSPAEVVSINIESHSNTAYIAVPDRQISLAIGKDGQNARLAAKLTGLRLDICGEGSMIESGKNLFPPPEPNLDALFTSDLDRKDQDVAISISDEVIPSQSSYGRPGLPGEQLIANDTISSNNIDDDQEHLEVQLTPEQEILEELLETETVTSDIAQEETVSENIAPPSEQEEPRVLRFADEIREIRLQEEDRERNRRGKNRRRGGSDTRSSRRRGRQDYDFDEDEIEAALHGNTYEDDTYDDFDDEYDD